MVLDLTSRVFASIWVWRKDAQGIYRTLIHNARYLQKEYKQAVPGNRKHRKWDEQEERERRVPSRYA